MYKGEAETQELPDVLSSSCHVTCPSSGPLFSQLRMADVMAQSYFFPRDLNEVWPFSIFYQYFFLSTPGAS